MWRDVPGFPGYQVSSDGRVRSLRKELSPWLTNGYPTVSLRRDGVTYRRAVHALVALAFIGPRPAGADVCHANGDKADNRVENLRYDTRSENIRDQVEHGTHNHARVTRCPEGHAYTPDNTYVLKGGRRQCKTCTKARAADRYAAQKEIAP